MKHTSYPPLSAHIYVPPGWQRVPLTSLSQNHAHPLLFVSLEKGGQALQWRDLFAKRGIVRVSWLSAQVFFPTSSKRRPYLITETQAPQPLERAEADDGKRARALTTATSPQIGASKPLYTVTEFTFRDQNTDTEFTIRYKGKRFIICLSADSFSESPSLKDKYLFFLRVADEFKLECHIVDGLYD